MEQRGVKDRAGADRTAPVCVKGADMQETFKKIIEKLEEKSIFMTTCDGYGANCVSVGTIEEIVKQEAEKFGTDTNVGSNGWIPVSERLPNEDEFIKSYRRNKYAAEFIVMIKGANRPTTLYFTHDGRWTDNMKDRYDVTAWMPLPEPYRESEEELADEIYNELTEI